MAKLNKRMYRIYNEINKKKEYNIIEIINVLKNNSNKKFRESVDVAIKLGIDARKSDQTVKGFTLLPHGIGRVVRVAVFTKGPNVSLAKKAGAELVGMEDLAKKIKKGERKFDIVIATENAMSVVGKVGNILGPRGMIPNKKLGTIVTNIEEAVKNAKKCQVRYRNEKNGIIHASIGRIDFQTIHIKENLENLLVAIKKEKPSHTKGMYIKKISLSTTMGAGGTIDKGSINNIWC